MTSSVWRLVMVCVIMTLVVPSEATCPQGWTRLGFKCTRLFLEPMTWKAAEANCQSFSNDASERGHLLSLADVKETTLLSLIMDEAQQGGTWVGLAQQEDNNNMMTWSNGLPIDLFSVIENELLDFSRGGGCTQATIEEKQPTLRTTSCNTMLPYACELSDCPGGWTSYAGSCFKHFDKKKSWSEAEDFCQGHRKDEVKGHLVSIATDDENRFLSEWQKAASGNENLGDTWIGLYGIPGGDRFFWTAELDFANDGQADLQQISPNYCTEMHKTGDGLWGQTSDCNQAATHICKLSHCPVGLVAFRDQCLLYLGRPDTDADETPGGEGHSQSPRRSPRNRRSAPFNFGALANRFRLGRTNPQTSQKSSAITRKVSFSNLWKKRTSSKSPITRTLGSSVKKSPFSGLSFGKSFQITRSGTSGKRLPFTFGAAFRNSAKSKSVSTGISSITQSPPRPQQAQSLPAQGAPVPAQKAPAPARPSPVPVKSAAAPSPDTSSVNQPVRPFVSSTSQTASCPGGWTKQGSSCYKFFAEEKSWDDAEDHCKNIDLGDGVNYQAHLTTIENVLENLLLGLMVKSQAGGAHTWIGKKKMGEQNSWIVNEGTDFNANLVQSQRDGAPDGCAFINHKAEWGHTECSARLRFLCKFKKTEKYKKSVEVVPESRNVASSALDSALTSELPARSTGQKYCFPTWKEHSGFCYHFSVVELPWEEARDICRSYFFGNEVMEQANLVSITSAEENDFLMATSVATNSFWIGRNGNAWLDGKVLGYRASEINAASPGLCSYAVNKRWGYQDCGQKLRYVCKMPMAKVERVVRKRRSLKE
ncbi:uncharacterized protein LOC110989170 [Acanthaster planci]|uniref:Uncharacterized protein LOC110989170 n=1 Tax=Acanthaster planci TaxID=133434 RepID=A0A8B7ZTZ0_ACAPL|nr:uncharacterized protein LOC110989170 [Acanthaster planci]